MSVAGVIGSEAIGDAEVAFLREGVGAGVRVVEDVADGTLVAEVNLQPEPKLIAQRDAQSQIVVRQQRLL